MISPRDAARAITWLTCQCSTPRWGIPSHSAFVRLNNELGPPHRGIGFALRDLQLQGIGGESTCSRATATSSA